MFKGRKLASYIALIAVSLNNIGFSEDVNPKEALLLRRISEYWKDGDYATVKRQVVDFLEKNPNTPLHDHLHSMLGDLYFQEHNFSQALTTYGSISNPEISEKIFFNHLQAHFEMHDYLSVIEKGETYLKDKNGLNPDALKVRYLIGESCFRYALNCSDMEKKVFYLKLAKPHYKLLTQTSYSDRSLFPLAEIHRLLREDDRAVPLYFTLAEKYPEHKERLLFQAAILQIKDNKLDAINTFFKVHAMRGKRCRLAAFNALILMYQTKGYEDFLKFHKDVIALMPDQKVPLLNFYEGRCHYALGDYNQAVLPLESYITAAKEKSKELKTAYLLLANCSRYLKDISLLERTFSSYKTSFPKDLEAVKMLMIHAQMCKEEGNFTEALADLNTVCSEYPDLEDAETALYDSALILSQMDRWTEARETLASFLEKYPQSERNSSAWRHLLNCSIEELKDEKAEGSKEAFVTILSKALSLENVLNEREKNQYTLVLLKCQCELSRYEEAIPTITSYLSNVKDPSLLAEAHLLMALCQKNIGSDPSLFIEHSEKALEYNPQLTENGILHLELYNAYLTKGLFERSADHLFASGAWKNKTIKLDNYLWLTNFFYTEAKKGNHENFEKAKLLFTNLFGEDGHLYITSSDFLYLEAEALKYAHILELNGKRKDQIALLETLVRNQEELPHLNWKLRRRSVLELARAYEAAGQSQNAINSYWNIVKTAEKGSSIVTNTAHLHLAKLKYNLLNPMDRTNENPEVIAVLHTLKDLQIQKKLAAEPLHLEAALRYAEIRASMSSVEEISKNGHFFYKRMFDDFHNTADPITESYTHMREKHPEKDAIFSAYMKYLEAQMLKCEAEIAKLEKKEELKKGALQIVNTLLQNNECLQPYLIDRIRKLKVEITE